MSDELLRNMHGRFLEALRHREQEIFSYLGILVPAAGGFVWLLIFHLKNEALKANALNDEWLFTCATLGVLLMLFLGAAYSLALGYNYRYITFQLAKIEHYFGAHTVILKGWPKSRDEFLRRYRIFKCIPWRTPPAIINVFWLAFLVAIVFVTASASATILNCSKLAFVALLLVGVSLSLWSAILPIRFGCKLSKLCEDEDTEWQGKPNLS